MPDRPRDDVDFASAIGWASHGLPKGFRTVLIGGWPASAGPRDVEQESGRLYVQLAGSSYAEAEALSRQLTTERHQIIFLGDLLQRLEDPRPLLSAVRSVLQRNPHSRLVLSILDPSARLPGDGRPVAGDAPPWIRLWTTVEVREFLQACGFEITAEKRLGTAADEGATTNHTFLLSCSEEHYQSHLERNGLPPPTVEYLLFTTEHSACKVTGGIGAYVEQMEKLLSPETFATCYVGDQRILPEGSTANRRWILPSRFVGTEEWEVLPPPELTYRLVQVLAFLYPRLTTIEFQEYLGLGHLAGQAKRSGLLPAGLVIKTRCHGSRIYLEGCFAKWAGLEHLETAYQEKVSIEQADVVSLPSRFLLDLYRSKGYRIDDSKVEIRKYPFVFPPPPHVPAPQPIDTLIFFGKRTTMKGFPSFVDTLSRIVDQPGRHGIQRVVVIGRVDPDLREENRRLAKLAAQIELIEFVGTKAEAIAMIERHAGSALCVMPYEGDNHPMSVLEAASTGCAVLAANTGGIPEMLPEEFHSIFLHEPGKQGLYSACLRILGLSPQDRSRLVEECLAALKARYEAVNAGHLAGQIPSAVLPSKRQRRSTVAVIVPCYESKLEHIRDLVYGLNHQTLFPDQVCFVDDGSSAGYASHLEKLLAEELVIPFRIVRHQTNRGLASARNTGLRSVSTDYVVNIDSDDVPKPDFIRDYVHFLDHDPAAVAVTSWLESFRDGDDWLDAAACSLIYKPLGDGLMLAQTSNCLGHANSAFRRDFLLTVDGWDESDRSMWEDWALFIRILSLGHRIGVVPKSNILYRVNDASMARTYAKFPAMNRLARNLTGVATFEAYRLQALMREYADLHQEHDQITHTLSYRIARGAADIVNRHPRVKAPLKRLILFGEALLKRLSDETR